MITINGQYFTMDTFPDSTKKIVTPDDLDKIINIAWRFDDNSETLTLYYLCEHLRDAGHYLNHLFMPYVPNARMDRVKSGEEVFMLKYFAAFINALNFERVTILDPHSHVTPALFCNVEVLSPEQYIRTALADIGIEDTVLFYPDEGAMKRYSEMIKAPYLFGVKDRDWKTGTIKHLSVMGDTDLIKEKSVLIIDDICCRGGTFIAAAEKLRELGAVRVYLYVTHCENTMMGGLIPNSDLIDRVYTTNSLFTEKHEKVRVFEIV